MPKDVCLRLSQNSKVAWNKLNDDSKAIILSSSKPTKERLSPKPLYKASHIVLLSYANLALKIPKTKLLIILV